MLAQDTLLCRGSFFTEDQANIFMKKTALEWNNRASWEKRATMIRNGITEGLKIDKMPQITQKFSPIIRNKHILDGYMVENIAIESFPGFYITGNLYRPSDTLKTHPAILCPHGHGEDYRFSHDMQVLCASLARMGAIVFAYDMIGLGESKQVTHQIPIAALLQTWNSKRIVDYLITRSDVDAKNIGITGHSGGGTQTFLITAIDNRITASAPVVQVSAHFFGGCVCESGMPIHRTKNYQTNNVEIAALCAPRPLLIVSDGADWTRNTPRVEYPYIQKVYAVYDAEHKVENVHFPAGKHDYGYSKRAVVYLFLAHHLHLDISKIPYEEGFNENFVTFLPKSELKVFTEINPIPNNALVGNDTVLKFLKLN
jgi:uncharacterized protein